jgi:tether containing UBX domain for GLUT4
MSRKTYPKLKQIDRNIHFYNPIANQPLKIELPDSFYQLTAAEVQIQHEQLKLRASTLENRPLETQQMREARINQQRSQYPKTKIRVKFGDQRLMEIDFLSNETLEALFVLVRQYTNTDEFRLYVSPPIRDLDVRMTFWEAKLAPASLVHYSSAQELRFDGVQFEEYSSSSNISAAPAEPAVKAAKSKVPKWLKFGK